VIVLRNLLNGKSDMKKQLNKFILTCALILSGTANAEIYGLLIFNGDYQGGIPKLEGVKHDVASARSIAHLMGVKDENMQVHQELTLEGMRNAFDQLDQRVTSGDKVFIYYSGHGGRQYVTVPVERCGESLVSINGGFFSDAELEEHLQKLSGRAQKVIAMLDSCHSGGVTTRAVQNKKFTPKYWSKGGQDACYKPSNIVTRSISKATRSAGTGGKNYVYIAAAKNDEVSLDQPDKGGFATLAWAECMAGEAKDADGSGGLTAEEIRVCAQQKIDAQTKGLEGVLPQHISVIGNSDLVMTLVASKADTPVIQVTPTTPLGQDKCRDSDKRNLAVNRACSEADGVSITAAQVSAPSVVQLTIPVAQSGAPATLLDIFNGRDDRRTVTITPVKNRLKIGSDKFSFSLRSSHTGYLYLLMVGSDGNTFDLLFPNKLDGDNYIKADQTLQFPRPSWEVVAQGPVGTDHILAIVSDAPRDLSQLSITNAGPFSVVSATSTGQRDIQRVTSTASAAQQSECSDSKKRNLAVKQICSDAYGAALESVEEQE